MAEIFMIPTDDKAGNLGRVKDDSGIHPIHPDLSFQSLTSMLLFYYFSFYDAKFNFIILESIDIFMSQYLFSFITGPQRCFGARQPVESGSDAKFRCGFHWAAAFSSTEGDLAERAAPQRLRTRHFLKREGERV